MALIDVKEAVKKAREEVNDELTGKAIEKLKNLYRKRDMAQVALANIDREIADEEARIGEGNITA